MTVFPSRDEERKVAAGKKEDKESNDNIVCFVRGNVKAEIGKQVLRCKLAKCRHLVVKEAFDPSYLDSIFPMLLKLFDPQHVTYNGGIANVKDWKISCYLEVMDGGIPTTNPNFELRDLFSPLMSACDDLFLYWYRQQHACNASNGTIATTCRRLMTFITRYTPAPGEQALLKVCDTQFRLHYVLWCSFWIQRQANLLS